MLSAWTNGLKRFAVTSRLGVSSSQRGLLLGDSTAKTARASVVSTPRVFFSSGGYKKSPQKEEYYDAEGRELIKLRRGGFAVKMREVEVVRKSMPTSVKKLKLLTDLIRDMKVPDALLQLRYCRKLKSADLMQQINEGTLRAEEQFDLKPHQLKIGSLRIGNAPMMKRVDIKGRGRTGVIRRRFCHLYIKLREIDTNSNDPWKLPGLRKKHFRSKLRKYKLENKGKIKPVPIESLPEGTSVATPSTV